MNSEMIRHEESLGGRCPRSASKVNSIMFGAPGCVSDCYSYKILTISAMPVLVTQMNIDNLIRVCLQWCWNIISCDKKHKMKSLGNDYDRQVIYQRSERF